METNCRLFYTGNSVKGAIYKEIVNDIAKKTNEIGLLIISCTSDMGASNKAMWKSFGIVSSQSDLVLVSRSYHPIALGKNLFFIADIPHLLKNIKNYFVSNKMFVIPEVVQKNTTYLLLLCYYQIYCF